MLRQQIEFEPTRFPNEVGIKCAVLRITYSSSVVATVQLYSTTSIRNENYVRMFYCSTAVYLRLKYLRST
jgi:hypothetical protein